MMPFRDSHSRGLCFLVAAHLAFPAVALAQPANPVHPRAIELFNQADTQLAQKNFEAAVLLAERVLQYTDPVHHRDQRGTIMQLIAGASFEAHKETGRDAVLCHLDRVLDAYAIEVQDTYHNATRDRILAGIEDLRNRVSHSVASCPSPGTEQVDPKTPTAPTPELRSEAVRATAGTHEEPEPAQSSLLARRQKTTHFDARHRARTNPSPNIATGATLLGIGGVLLGGVGVSLWQFDVAARALDDIQRTLQAENRPDNESERASSAANLAKAVTSLKLAIGMGVGAGVMVLVGIPLLAVGLHRRKALRVVPAVSGSQVGLGVLGHF